MNLEVFREGDTVFIRDTDTDDEWPLPADVWAAVHQPIVDLCKVEIDADTDGAVTAESVLHLLGLPPVWGTHPADGQTGLADATPPDGRATPIADHPHTDPGDGRQQCIVCGKYVWPATHSCKGVMVAPLDGGPTFFPARLPQ